jgi:3-oxoacyl-[acyl-carrier protein] reductase
MPFKESREVMNVNFWGSYNIIQNLLPECEEGCNIINIASVSGMVPDKDLPIYAASKAAVIAMTKSLAKQLAPRMIRVNCISPGFFKTNLVNGEDLPDDLLKTIPLGYEELPSNITPVIEMILHSRYMTGSNIVIDGGVTA